ncbi:acid-sensing ion channel 1-like [Plakobranchus ocellatus]|uniref:Acid-sensing ion channel 1-like n=1 Tax=Plakobranchus ocellatus TaxID=259542 RepID=A0AAV3ZJK6_9GAST|nr:acid-sensing ion channel 1-like [Plakobranchus ocellatus]
MASQLCSNPGLASDSNKTATKTTTKNRILRLLTQFGQETTLHGCKHLQDSNSPIFLRVAWSLILITMVAALAISLTMLWIHYRSYPFTTVWSLSREAYVPLPSLTLCLYADFDTQKTASWQDATQYMDNRWHVDQLLTNQFANLNYSEAQQRFGFDTNDVFLGVFSSVLKEHTIIRLSDWVTPDPDPGRACWIIYKTKNLDSGEDFKIGMFDSFVMILNPMTARAGRGFEALGVELYFHEPGTRYWLQRGLGIMPGAYADVRLKPERTKFLPSPYNSAGSKGCVDTQDPDFVNPLRFFESYSLDLCISELLIKEVQKECSCVSQPYASMLHVNECTVLQYQTCYFGARQRIMSETLLSDSSQCLDLCNTRKFSSTISYSKYDAQKVQETLQIVAASDFQLAPESEMADLIRIRIQPLSMDVTTMEHVPETTLLDVFAQVGGFMGLFLGASLMTLVEIIDVVLLMGWTWLLSSARRERKLEE